MGDDREVRKEKSFLGGDKEVIYDGGEKVGELRTEKRGGFFGLLEQEEVKVEIDNDLNKKSYIREEERGIIFEEPVEVEYKASTHEQIGFSKIEERGFVPGLKYHARVGYRSDGTEVSETVHEKRGGIFGFDGQPVKVTKYKPKTEKVEESQKTNKIDSASVTYSPEASLSSTNTADSGSVLGTLATLAGLAIGVPVLGQALMFAGSSLTKLPFFTNGPIEFIVCALLGIVGAVIWAIGFVLSLPLFAIEGATGACLAMAPGTVKSAVTAASTITYCN